MRETRGERKKISVCSGTIFRPWGCHVRIPTLVGFFHAIISILYVDDIIIITGDPLEEISKVKAYLLEVFETENGRTAQW